MIPVFVLFSYFTLSFSPKLRDILIGEWGVYPENSDFTQTSYTIEFHQSSYDSIDQNVLNCTIWKDESMHSYLPSSFVFSAQGPLTASLQISFSNEYSGSIYNIKTGSFNQDSSSNVQLRTDFSFDSNFENADSKISKFTIGKYNFVVDLSEFSKKGQISVEVSSSINENDSSLKSLKNKYVIIRTKEFENKYLTKQKQPVKNSHSNFNQILPEPIEAKVVNKIREFVDKMEINASNSYIIIAIVVLFMFIIFLITKIIAACVFSSKKGKSGAGKKTKKYKKKLENKKDELNTNEIEKINENIEKERSPKKEINVEKEEKENDDNEKTVKIKTD